MPEEMKQETMELVVTACEKHAANNEVYSLNIRVFKLKQMSISDGSKNDKRTT